MSQASRKGFGFGLTSGVITTLGLIVGLHSGTHSTSAVIGGILIIAVADALSDSFAIHISEEFEKEHTVKQIWKSSLMTLVSKFAFALSFIPLFLLLTLYQAAVVSVIWGLSLITFFSFYIGYEGDIKAHRVVAEHLALAILVIVLTHYTGALIASL